MNDSVTSFEQHTTVPAPRQSGRRSLQMSLATMLLLTAAVGSWLAAWTLDRKNQELQVEVETLQKLSGELLVTNPTLFAVISQRPQWHGDYRWRVFLPPGFGYRLNVSTRQIPASRVFDDSDQLRLQAGATLPQPAAHATMPAGIYEIALKEELHDNGWHIELTRDGEVVLQLDEQSDWPSESSSDIGSWTTTHEQSADKPLVLMQRRYTKNRIPPSEAPTNGLMIWFEQAH